MFWLDKYSSFYKYELPVKLPEIKRFPNSPMHKGPYLHAEDIAVPNPLNERTVIYAPQSGKVWSSSLISRKWGDNPDFAIYLNYINVYVGFGEFYEIAHIASLPEIDIRTGKEIHKGEPILIAALNGYITTTAGVPDSHVHMMVGKWLNKERTKFKSLKISWES